MERIRKFIKLNYLYLVGAFLYLMLAFSMLGGTLQSFIICVLIYAASMGIAVSPIGEWLIRFINHVRPIETKKEMDYLTPLFTDVYLTAKHYFPDIGNIQLYIQDNMTVNALAINTHTIAVTKGAIETFSEDELKGMLFHEIAHIYYGHTTMNLLATIGNGFFSIFVLIARTLLLFIDIISNPNGRGLGHFIVSIIRFMLEAMIFVFLLFFNIIFSINSRKDEYIADKFAYLNDYGQELIDALYILQKLSLEDNSKLTARITADHPRISTRIMKLEILLDNEE